MDWKKLEYYIEYLDNGNVLQKDDVLWIEEVFYSVTTDEISEYEEELMRVFQEKLEEYLKNLAEQKNATALNIMIGKMEIENFCGLFFKLPDNLKLEILDREDYIIHYWPFYVEKIIEMLNPQFVLESIEANLDISLKTKSFFVRMQKQDYIIEKITSGMFDELDEFHMAELLSFLQPEQKIEIMKKTNILSGSPHRKSIFCNLKPETALEYIERDSDIGLLEKSYMIRSQSSDYIIEKINSGIFDSLDYSELNELILCTENPQYICECINSGRYKIFSLSDFNKALLNVDKLLENNPEKEKELQQERAKLKVLYAKEKEKAIEKLINGKFGSNENFEELKKIFVLEESEDGFCIEIKDTSELSIELLEVFPEITSVIFNNSNDKENKEYLKYTREEYLEVKSVMNKLLAGVEKPKNGNFESEFQVFCEVASRLSNFIEYDYEARDEIYKMRNGEECDQEKIRKSQNLIGGLVANGSARNKTVCAGYSRILMNALAEVGIDCKVVSGYRASDYGGGHAWNQVKIGGQWFNFDLTWKRDEICIAGVQVNHLQTDATFTDHDVYSEFRPYYIEKCSVPASYVQRQQMDNDKASSVKIEVEESLVIDMLKEDSQKNFLDASKLTNKSRLELVLCLGEEARYNILQSDFVRLPLESRKTVLNSFCQDFIKEYIGEDEYLSLCEKVKKIEEGYSRRMYCTLSVAEPKQEVEKEEISISDSKEQLGDIVKRGTVKYGIKLSEIKESYRSLCSSISKFFKRRTEPNFASTKEENDR